MKHTVQYTNAEGVKTTIHLEDLVDYLASKDKEVAKFIVREGAEDKPKAEKKAAKK